MAKAVAVAGLALGAFSIGVVAGWMLNKQFRTVRGISGTRERARPRTTTHTNTHVGACVGVGGCWRSWTRRSHPCSTLVLRAVRQRFDREAPGAHQDGVRPAGQPLEAHRPWVNPAHGRNCSADASRPRMPAYLQSHLGAKEGPRLHASLERQCMCTIYRLPQHPS